MLPSFVSVCTRKLDNTQRILVTRRAANGLPAAYRAFVYDIYVFIYKNIKDNLHGIDSSRSTELLECNMLHQNLASTICAWIHELNQPRLADQIDQVVAQLKITHKRMMDIQGEILVDPGRSACVCVPMKPSPPPLLLHELGRSAGTSRRSSKAFTPSAPSWM